jgi:hypothetical protein
MEMKECFNKLYEELDVKKELLTHSISLSNDREDVRVISMEIFEKLAQFLMLNSFAKGAEFSLEMIKKSSKFDDKLAEA